MQAPKRKTSKSKRNMRRSHHALTAGSMISCPQCGASVLRHHVCLDCGFYRKRTIIAVSEPVRVEA